MATTNVIYRSNSTKKILIAMADTFSDIKTAQRKSKRSKDFKDVTVPVYISSSEKLIARATKLAADANTTRISLPAIGMNITSMDLDENRILTPFTKIVNEGQFVFNPVPYNYTIDVALIAERESQLFDLIEQIVPFYRKSRYYPLIDFKFYDGTEIQRDLCMELTSTPISLQDSDIGQEDEQTFTATLSFMVKGWIYGSNSTIDFKEGDDKNTGSAGPGSGAGNVLIRYIDIDFENENDVIFENYLLDTEFTGDDDPDSTGYEPRETKTTYVGTDNA